MVLFNYRRRHSAYAWLPLFGAFLWFSMLLSMLITWLATGRPRYVSQEGSIAYISDIGADILKPLFITGGVITAVSFFLSLSIERLLRHERRLLPNMHTRERVFAILAIISSFIGGCGLILLTIFDTKRYQNLHRIFLLTFMVGVTFSAFFTIVEYHWLSKDFREARKLKVAYRAKAFIAITLVLLSAAFAVTLFRSYDTGAVLEWTIAFAFTFYFLTFFYDLRQAEHIDRRGFCRGPMISIRASSDMRMM